MRTLLKLVLLLLAAILLAGCLDTATHVSIGADGSGTLSLEYVVDRPVYETGLFDPAGPLPIPIRRVDFENAAAGIDGLRLTRHRVDSDDEFVTVTARLRFDTTDALVAFFGEEWLTVTTRGEQTVWRQLLVPSREAGEESRFLAEDLDGYTMLFEIDPDQPIVSVSGGELVGDDSARVQITLGEIARGTQERYLEVVW
jgi:hypothetical protein